MYRILGIFFVFFTFVPASFALGDATFKISSDKTELTKGNTVTLQITLKSKDTSNVGFGNLSIPGLDNFEILSTSTSMQFININGENAAEVGESFVLRAKNIGSFTLGPIQYGSGKTALKSNSLSIKVTETQKNSAPQFTTEDNTATILLDDNENNPLDTLIYFSAGFLAILIVFIFAFRWITSRKKQVPKSPIKPQIYEEKTIENALEQIRKHLARTYGIKTESLTLQELSKLEQDQSKKLILQKCLLAIQGREYGNVTGKDEEILHLLHSYLNYESTRNHA